MISAALPDLDKLDVEALKALAVATHGELLEQHKILSSTTQEIEHLKLVIEKYRRMIFGRKSKKLTAQLEQLEIRLEDLETAQSADEARQAEAEAPSATQPAAKSRSRPVRKPGPQRQVLVAGVEAAA
jgi:hypothetical protein